MSGAAGMAGGGRGGRLLASPGDLTTPPIHHLGLRIWGLLRPYRRKLTGTAVLVVIGAGLSVAVPLLTQRAFDDGLFPPRGGTNLAVLAQLVGLMALVTVVASGLNVWRTYLTTSVGNHVMADVRSQLFSHLQTMELAFFTRTKTGVIQSRLANDVGGVAGVLTNTVPSILANTVTVLSALAAMLLLSWQLTIVALILLPFLIVLQVRIGRVRREIARKTQESLSDMTAITQEALSVSGIVLSKVFNQEDAETARYRSANHQQLRLQIRQQMTGQRFFGAVQIFMNITPAIVSLCAGWLLTQSWPITAGTLVAFTTLQARISMPILSLMRVSLDVQTSQALFARIFEYLDLKPGIVDQPGARTLDPSSVRGALTLDAVSFSYLPGKTISDDAGWALREVSLSIAPGEFAAFVGPSGAGKTTLSYLIPRLYEATCGTIRLDGTDIQELTLASLHQCIGMVTQETYLFHSTIAENLRYAKADASDEELIAAAKVANIHERIMEFDDGYQTVVGERGYRLSGGEKQRLAIARVVLKNPPLLILDEATSALDTTGERLVQSALEAVMAGRTTIAIAHRLSTIVAADRIFVLEKGRLTESGTHQELLAASGTYAELNLQQGAGNTGARAV
ncbi:ABC transporter ATP-binding protein [Paenarthrobacter sp. Z7-10]|uniref:ABC transporter ATP-binding protein n=1 Tax=Paenarthrobacter sp. Z7-10 TaxID=2787635 RepID=UPI0022A8FDB7|nr:ABC transporter ATP-binding protein [Paenarthrobacter sp. Z7-10]MCZ2404061.1 ABC transporter ATP-binding protein [Paenarthrobacter sp. Z7-10]